MAQLAEGPNSQFHNEEIPNSTEAKDHPESTHHKRGLSFHSHKDTASPSGSSTEAHRFPIFKKSSGHGDKDDAKPHHHGHSHGDHAQQHHHETRHRNIFGNEDSNSASAQKQRDLFGSEDVPTSEKGHAVFGFEDVEFENTGHSVFGIEDQDTDAAQKQRQVFGFEDADKEEHRDVFGSEEDEEDSGRCKPNAHVRTMNKI